MSGIRLSRRRVANNIWTMAIGDTIMLVKFMLNAEHRPMSATFRANQGCFIHY